MITYQHSQTHTSPETPSTTALVHTTATRGPARQLIDEWERLAISRPILRKVNAWGIVPEPISHLDELLQHAGFGRATDDSQADHVLWLLVRRAEHDELAARIVLHRVLPAVLAISQRRGRIIRGGMYEALDETVSTAWMVIRTFPHQRRTSKIAANLCRDIEYHAFVRQSRLRSVDIDPRSELRLTLMASPDERIDPAEELHELLSDAEAAGLSDRHSSLLRDLATGMSTEQAAINRNMSARTMRNHKHIAINAFHQAHRRATKI
jgi:hypothetical protein